MHIEAVFLLMETHVFPKASPVPQPELATYLGPFTSLFRRSTSRESLERYVTGLLTDLPHKTCDTIAAAIAATSTERLQHLITDAVWDPQALDQQRVRALVAQSPPQGILGLDDNGLPRQGRSAVGVARQYVRTPGKIARCQVIVIAHYVADEPTSRAPVHWPVTAPLYLPEVWATESAPRQGLSRAGSLFSDEAGAGVCPRGSGPGLGRPVCLCRRRRWLRRQLRLPAGSRRPAGGLWGTPFFPAVHRQVLLWLFQDVVLWLIATNEIRPFPPQAALTQ
jgi:DDE superfamily endonuclease